MIVEVAALPAVTVEELSIDAESEYDEPLEPEDGALELLEPHPKQTASIAAARPRLHRKKTGKRIGNPQATLHLS
jgi:hypothetical protein